MTNYLQQQYNKDIISAIRINNDIYRDILGLVVQYLPKLSDDDTINYVQQQLNNDIISSIRINQDVYQDILDLIVQYLPPWKTHTQVLEALPDNCENDRILHACFIKYDLINCTIEKKFPYTNKYDKGCLLSISDEWIEQKWKEWRQSSDLAVTASALNFLSIASGSSILRYST